MSMYMYMYVCMCVYVCMYACMYMYVYMCIYVCMCVCTYSRYVLCTNCIYSFTCVSVYALVFSTIIILFIVLDFIYIYNFYFLVAMLRSEGNLLPLHLWSPSFSSTIVLYNENICFVCLSLYMYDVK